MKTRLLVSSCPNVFMSSCLTLRELEALACARTARLFPFDLTRIPREQPALAQRLAHLLVIAEDRARQTQANRACLTRLTATINQHVHIEPTLQVRRRKRLGRMLLQRRAREEIVRSAAVDLPIPAARTNPDPSNTGLAATYAVVL